MGGLGLKELVLSGLLVTTLLAVYSCLKASKTPTPFYKHDNEICDGDCKWCDIYNNCALRDEVDGK